MTRFVAILVCLCAFVAQGQQPGPNVQKQFDEAYKLQKAGKLTKAKALYRSILHAQPKLSGAHLNLALIYVAEGHKQEALSHVRAAVDAAPNDSNTALVAARVYGMTGDAKSCERMLGKVTGKERDTSTFLFLRGSVRAVRGDLPGAERDLASARSKAPTDVQIVATLASIKLQLNKGPEAVRLLDQATKRAPQQVILWQALAQACLLGGDLKHGMVALEKVHHMRPDDINPAILLASVYANANRLPAGISLLGQMINRFPTNAALRVAQADLLMRARMWSDAEQQLKVAQDYLAHPDASIMDRLAQIALETGNFDEAAGYWDQIVRTDRQNLSAYQRLEGVYQRQNALDKLRGLYRQWMANIPSDPYPSRQIAALYRQERNYQSADVEYQRHLKQFPKDNAGRRGYAFMMEANGKREEAVKQYRECIRLDKNDLEARLSLGEVLFHLNQDDEAIKALKEAQTVFPTSTRPGMTLAAHFEQMKKPDLAELEYRQVLKTNPKELEAMARLANILEQKKDIDGTIALYEKLIALSRNPAVDFSHIPELLWRNGRKDEARRRWTDKITQKPTDVALRLQYGEFLDGIGELDAAAQQYKEASRLKPRMPDPLTKLVGIYDRQKKEKESEAVLLDLLRMDPDAGNTFALLYNHYLAAGRPAAYWDAILPYAEKGSKEDAALTRIVEIAPALKRVPEALALAKKRTAGPKVTRAAWLALAAAYRDSGEWPKAVQFYAKAARLSKQDVGALREYVMVADEHGTKQEAVEACKFYVDCQPNDVWGLMRYGNLLVEAKRAPEAIDVFNHVLELFPDNQDARKARDAAEKALG